MVSSLNRKAERPIEWRQVALTKTLSLTLPKTNTGDTRRVLHLIVQWDRVAPDVQPVGQGIEPLARLVVDLLCRVQDNPGSKKPFPTGHSIQLPPDESQQRL